MPIGPDVYLIEGKASNLYLCCDESGLALIDAGMPGDEKAVLARVAELGYQPDQLTRILITHADIDHAGGLAALQQATGATIFASNQTVGWLQNGKSPPHLPTLIQWVSDVFFGYRAPASRPIAVGDGDSLPVLGELIALATPGHTLDHFSFYSPRAGVLFAGDALHTRKGRLQRSQKHITADEEAANASAIRLLQLAPAIFACGHGRPLENHKAEELTVLFNKLRQNDAAS
jgi:glyoxylase-like metal-dependent hydrolase (beta-lactamase superfamily II)